MDVKTTPETSANAPTIGVFDSGIGGLTVVRALLERLPDHPIVYLGDTARTPYGNKSAQTIIRYSLNNTDFLVRHGAKIIVIACNTASSYSADAIREKFGVAVFETITPGAALAVAQSRNKRIGVIGTRATIASSVYDKRIKSICPEARIHSKPCPLLVPLVEEGWLRKPETVMIIKKYVHPLKSKQIDTLILGCTHYPVLKKLIQQKVGKRVVLVDSAEAIASDVENYLQKEKKSSMPEASAGNLRIFITDTRGAVSQNGQNHSRKDYPHRTSRFDP